MSIQLPNKRCSYPPYDPLSFLLTPISSSSLTTLSASTGLIFEEVNVPIFSPKSKNLFSPGLLPIYPPAATKLPLLDSGLGIPALRITTFPLPSCLSPVLTRADTPSSPWNTFLYAPNSLAYETTTISRPAPGCLIQLLLLSP